eukprot:5231301-Pleurochrysis_carterae.AAC.1
MDPADPAPLVARPAGGVHGQVGAAQGGDRRGGLAGGGRVRPPAALRAGNPAGGGSGGGHGLLGPGGR